MAWKIPKILEVQVGREIICTPARRANSFANICEAEEQVLTRFLGALEPELLPRLLLVGVRVSRRAEEAVTAAGSPTPDMTKCNLIPLWVSEHRFSVGPPRKNGHRGRS